MDKSSKTVTDGEHKLSQDWLICQKLSGARSHKVTMDMRRGFNGHKLLVMLRPATSGMRALHQAGDEASAIKPPKNTACGWGATRLVLHEHQGIRPRHLESESAPTKGTRSVASTTQTYAGQARRVE